MSKKFQKLTIWVCERCGFSVQFPEGKKPEICLDCGFVHFKKGETVDAD